MRRWDTNSKCIHGYLSIQRGGQKLQNETKLHSKRLCTRYKQAKCKEQTLCKDDDKLVCTGAIGSLAFIGTLLIRAGIEQNPGPWNGPNKEELRQSENYVWKTGDALGRGATAVVYKARSKHTRDVVAVKVFHDRVSTQFANVALREIEVLRRLKHRNVISILCTEQEMNTGSFVLVMELCTGGSLYSMLDQPKFAFGFPEEEFLLVMKDIAEGMKYIRQQEYVHRDIKPGNIMRFIDDKGSSVYKFTDFGAARQLDEQESFSSIYGTEEYLDPDMYKKAVLRQHIGTFFDASVDLWSLGVTMYHVATGFLPFQPYGGRSNTATMFKITSEKESGVISGIQSEENGPIKWSKELPKSCMLSSNLKSLITPMFAGMMESNRALRWSFEKYFDYVHTIVNMVSLKVFYSSRGCNLKIYIDGKSRFAALQEHIAMETEIPASEQLLIFNNKELKEVVDATSEIQSYSKNILEGQLFLFNKERYQQDTLVIPDILAFPAIQSFRNYDRDSHIAHSSCAVAYYTDKVIAWLIDAQKLMKQADTLLRDYISRITSRIDDSLPDMYRLLGETNKRQATFYSSYEQVLSLYKILSKINRHSKTIGPICEEAESKLAKILTDRSAQDVIQKAENRAEEIKVYTSVLIEKLKEQEQEAISNSVGCLDTDKW
ncbi:hypothetical protein KUTeg_021279 [Tegillarca granosa]|uniref:Protein kinase domain-containing protein n=1 Tax=Tegillarca granosa TaxID=220873 RepID=A0ABQ9EFF4_TEGGR|nr:hypothetical protein KUTeg_021279 [Tegillarca granosa]